MCTHALACLISARPGVGGASARIRCDASERRRGTREPAERQLRHKVCLEL